jgi:hypothetical protein
MSDPRRFAKNLTRQYNPEDSSEHHTRRRENLKSHTTEHVTMEINYCLFTLLHDNEARLSSIIVYLRKRDVVPLHCCNSANATTKETSYIYIHTHTHTGIHTD